MTILRVVIADDEPVARQRLRRLLAEREDCRLIGEFEDGTALAKGIGVHPADIVLLDIDMPGPDGFSSFAALGEPKPLVVFVTAFAEFAAKAFDVDAVDYLLKPVSSARLGEALARARRRLVDPAHPETTPPGPPLLRFVVQGRVYLFEPARVASTRRSAIISKS